MSIESPKESIFPTGSLLTSTPFDFRDCEYEVWVGDEWCDDTQTANNAQCNFDGGDCCGPDWSLEYTYCDDCQCLLPDCPGK